MLGGELTYRSMGPSSGSSPSTARELAARRAQRVAEVLPTPLPALRCASRPALSWTTRLTRGDTSSNSAWRTTIEHSPRSPGSLRSLRRSGA